MTKKDYLHLIVYILIFAILLAIAICMQIHYSSLEKSDTITEGEKINMMQYIQKGNVSREEAEAMSANIQQGNMTEEEQLEMMQHIQSK